MDSTLHQLGAILLRAVPTFLLVIFLHFYLKSVFFKPFHRLLEQRRQATEGVRIAAQKSLDRAAAKVADYEAKMRAAKAEVYHAQEKLHKDLQDKQAEELLAVRKQAEAMIKQAKADLDKDVAAAKSALATESERLADQIADAVLSRSAA